MSSESEDDIKKEEGEEDDEDEIKEEEQDVEDDEEEEDDGEEDYEGEEDEDDEEQEEKSDVKQEEEQSEGEQIEEEQEWQEKNGSNNNASKKRINDVKINDLADQNGGSKNKKKVKKATEEEQYKAEDEDEEDDEGGPKFKYLEHRGVLFPDPWKRHNVHISYDGKSIQLDQRQEELATYWTQTLGTIWEESSIYTNNFTRQFLKLFGPEYQDFKKFNFQNIKLHLEIQKELKKNRSKEEKLLEKQQKEQVEKYSGFALVDGVKEKMLQYIIEPPTLFKGRGTHPKAGSLKSRILPEQITINLSEDAPIPTCSVNGHCWKEIVFKYDVTWLAGYKDNQIQKSMHKYVFLGATSRFKSQNDMKKYEKARKLKNCIEGVRNDYQRKMKSNDEKERQLATATYLIDKLALRVGNEKGEDEADTVGCCSLRCEHIKLNTETGEVTFDFLGKDSMRYFNTVKIDSQAFKNLKEFQKGKQDDNDLFDRIDASQMNDYLKTLMEGLTAKVFRTYNASSTLQNELDKSVEKRVDKMDVKQKIDFYEDAVKEVAILCNHQKTVSKNFGAQIDKMREKLTIMETYENELKEHIEKFKKNKNYNKSFEEKIMLEEKTEGKSKEFIKVFPDSKEKSDLRLQKLKLQINEENQKIGKKENHKEISLGTSKTNYNDPRISISWGKLYEVPVEKIFAKTLRDKFLWSMNIEPTWKF